MTAYLFLKSVNFLKSALIDKSGTAHFLHGIKYVTHRMTADIDKVGRKAMAPAVKRLAGDRG
jgi:hypothetical protein